MCTIGPYGDNVHTSGVKSNPLVARRTGLSGFAAERNHCPRTAVRRAVINLAWGKRPV